jgi:hypothetical protein
VLPFVVRAERLAPFDDERGVIHANDERQQGGSVVAPTRLMIEQPSRPDVPRPPDPIDKPPPDIKPIPPPDIPPPAGPPDIPPPSSPERGNPV